MGFYKFEPERTHERVASYEGEECGFISDARGGGKVLGVRGAGRNYYIKAVILPDLFKQAGCTEQNFSAEEIEFICRLVDFMPEDESIRIIAQLAKGEKAAGAGEAAAI